MRVPAKVESVEEIATPLVEVGVGFEERCDIGC